MPESDDRYARLDAARWLAAVAVVMLHGAATVVSDPAAYGSGAWLAATCTTRRPAGACRCS